MSQCDVLEWLAVNPGWHTQKEVGTIAGSYTNAQKLLCKLERAGDVAVRKYSRGKSNVKEYSIRGGV
jgi:hypothetical protein